MIIPVSASTVLLRLLAPVVVLPLSVVLVAVAVLTPECDTDTFPISIPIPLPVVAAEIEPEPEPETDLDRFGLEEDRVRSLLLPLIAPNLEGIPLELCSFRFSKLPPYENSCGTLVFELRYIIASGGDTLNLRCTKSVSLRRKLLSSLMEGGLSTPSLVAAVLACAPSPLVVGGASFDDDVIVTNADLLDAEPPSLEEGVLDDDLGRLP